MAARDWICQTRLQKDTLRRMHPADPGQALVLDPILIVDDEASILEAFSSALSPHFDVTTATSARAADFILQKKAFKVVVADHLMPGGNGMSFLVRAREEFPNMQRILVTGYMKPEMLIRRDRKSVV